MAGHVPLALGAFPGQQEGPMFQSSLHLVRVLTFAIKAEASETHWCLPAQWGIAFSVPASTFF